MPRFPKDKPQALKILLLVAAAAAFAIPAFSQQVDTSWVRRYNGPGNGNDSAVAIAVDSSGNVYVTGSSFDSTTGYDFCTIKYLPNGDTAWVRRYNGPANNDDFSRAIALDVKGNLCVTGSSDGDFLTLEYDSLGNQLWVQRFHSLFNPKGDGAFALALDSIGNVYVTGRSRGSEIEPILATIKYNASGVLLWYRLDYRAQVGSAIVLDALGNAYVAGTGSQLATSTYFTIKYDTNGNTIWTQVYSSPDSTYNAARAIILDGDGNTIVTGASSLSGFGAYGTVKYDTTGNQLWAQLFRDLPFAGLGAYAIAVDKAGAVYVTGAHGDGEDIYWTVVKYNPAGISLWSNGYSGHLGTSMKVDSAANIYVAGAGDTYQFATVKYDSAGNQLWVKGPLQGLANALSLDTRGNVYVTGVSSPSATGSDFTTIKYSPLPKLKGDLNLDGTLSSADVVLAVNCTFLGQAPPAAPIAADLNCDGKVTPADVVILLNMVFLSAPAPCWSEDDRS